MANKAPSTPENGRAMRPSSSVVMKLLIAALSLLIIGFSFETYQLTTSDPIVERNLKTSAQDSVFRVLIVTPFGVGGGTGYAIKSREHGVLVLTNKHICDAGKEMAGEEGRSNENTLFVLDQESKQYVTNIRRVASITDLCILEPPSDFVAKYKGLTLADRDYELEEGDTLFVYGHPGLRRLTASSGPFINEAWIPTFAEVVEADKIKVGRADLQIYPGSSGSPVLNSDGLVVGTIFAYEGGAGKLALFIPIDDIHDFLNGGM